MLQLARNAGLVGRTRASKSQLYSRPQKSPLLARQALREYRVEASELKNGDVIEHKNKLVEITKIQHVFGAQRAASMQAEFKDVRTGNKGQDKFRVSEEVEVMELDWKEVDYEGEKDGKFEFSDEEGEPFFLPKNFFSGKEVWLRPGVGVQVRMLDEDPLYYRFANRYQVHQVKVVNADQVGASKKYAELPNGVVIKAPAYLQNDAWIKVDITTEEYVSKEDGPPVEDDE